MASIQNTISVGQLTGCNNRFENLNHFFSMKIMCNLSNLFYNLSDLLDLLVRVSLTNGAVLIGVAKLFFFLFQAVLHAFVLIKFRSPF